MYRKPTPETIITRLGDASYSAYLFHPVVIIVVVAVREQVFGRGFAANLAVLIITFVITAPLSLASLYYFEKPSARFFRKLIEKAGVKPPRSEHRKASGVLTSPRVP